MEKINRIKLILTFILVFTVGLVHSQDSTVELFMPDGQLHDRPVRVYVSGIDDSQPTNFRLYLVNLEKNKYGSKKSIDEAALSKIKGEVPFVISRNQQWTMRINGNSETRTGTLLLFDLQRFQIPIFAPGKHALPILNYGQGKTVVSKKEIFISHRAGAVRLVIIIIIPLILFLCFLSKKDYYLLGLLSTADGRMSVSLTQMFLWTVAVGASVLIFGLTRLDVPHIPESLWVLMGLSVTTSAVSHFQTDSLSEIKRRKKTEVVVKPKLSHLVMVKLPDGREDADLSKAQLLFWTVITLTIYFMKSYSTGEIWDVPDALLILMGISQTGFLARKQLLIRQEAEPLKTLELKSESGKK